MSTMLVVSFILLSSSRAISSNHNASALNGSPFLTHTDSPAGSRAVALLPSNKKVLRKVALVGCPKLSVCALILPNRAYRAS